MDNRIHTLALGAALVLCASCSDDVPSIPASELYTRAFVREFGAVSPAQDWNAATRAGVSVTTGAPSAVRITADIRDRSYLLADYSEVSGTRTLNFDVPKGVETVRVSCGNRTVKVAVGGSVSFAAGSRAIWDNKLDPNNVVVFGRTDDYRELSDVAVRSFGVKLKESENNLGIVMQNFEFTANGPFVIYPVFWNTASYNTLGIYYMRKDESSGKEYMVHVPLYTPKIAPIDDTKGNLLYLPYGMDDVEDNWVYPGSPDPLHKPDSDCSYPEYFSYLEKFKNGKTDAEIAAEGFRFPQKWRSRGIYVNIEDGTRFGMYIRSQGWNNDIPGGGVPSKDNIASVSVVELELDANGMPVSDGYSRMYSNARYNGKNMHDPAYPGDESHVVDAVHGATYMYEAPSGIEYRVLGFEDWPSKTDSDRDLNDLIVFISSDEPEKIPDVEDNDPLPIKWLIACEDLGNKDDFDFNDVVFEVSYVAGTGKATITPLAAGGTLETYLMRGDEIISREWHDYFDHAPYTQMVNTTTISATAESFEIEVPADFSITSPAGADGYGARMGGFHLRVIYSGGSGTRDITAPGVGEAPQMLLVFQPEGMPWRWPLERHNIRLAFPGFEEWMNSGVFDVSVAGGNWSERCNPVHVVAR